MASVMYVLIRYKAYTYVPHFQQLLWVCVHTCARACLFVYMCRYTYTDVYVYADACAYEYAYAYVHLCVCVHMYVYAIIHVLQHKCTYGIQGHHGQSCPLCEGCWPHQSQCHVALEPGCAYGGCRT